MVSIFQSSSKNVVTSRRNDKPENESIATAGDSDVQDVRWEPCCNIWQGCEYTKLQVGHQQVFISHSGTDREISFLGRVVEMGPLVRTSLEIPVEGYSEQSGSDERINLQRAGKAVSE